MWLHWKERICGMSKYSGAFFFRTNEILSTDWQESQVFLKFIQ
jgi:hypothetical protein